MDTLVAVAPGLGQTGQKLHDLVQLDAAAMASEVFKLAADRETKEKELVSTQWTYCASLTAAVL